ncbi:MAG: S8 family serine peptidase [Bacillota bacterium]
MKMFKFALAALGSVMALGSVSAAPPPDVAMPVQFSGNVYHRAVCPKAVPNSGIAECHAHVVTDSRGAIMSGKVTADLLTAPRGFAPADLRSAYKVTSGGSSSFTVAVVDAYGYPNAERDLNVYRAQYGLPPCTTANGCFRKVNQNGGTALPSANLGWEQETALDLDMVSAMCPNCHILLVQASTASYSALATSVNTAVRLGARAVSNSYGGGEYGSGYYESAYNHPGVAITVSSGDDGYGVQFPASSPHVTAVGGTTLRRASNTRGWSETVWAGAGSGCSAYYAKPAWQTDALCRRRMVADVAAVADPYSGVAVYGPTGSTTSGWMVFGGTSVAAPVIAGIYGVNAGSFTYGSNPYARKTALFDVTSGSNGSCGGTYLCTGALSYDGPSGLGTPNGVSAF